MGRTRQQRVAGLQNQVAWLTWRERLAVAWALLTWHATDEVGNRIH
jgi:hypothetical protein